MRVRFHPHDGGLSAGYSRHRFLQLMRMPVSANHRCPNIISCSPSPTTSMGVLTFHLSTISVSSMECIIGIVCFPSNPLTLQRVLRGIGRMPKKCFTIFIKTVSMKVYLLALVLMSKEVLMPNPLLLTVHTIINTSPSSNRLRSTSANSVPFAPEEESSLRVPRFPAQNRVPPGPLALPV
jgi:hypothetical protein